ncbi:MAG: TonB-dependent receptor [Melioribacteraceae bacterium]|nr:TonB-dependent receptor [Melioribacteraceae bacterium]
MKLKITNTNCKSGIIIAAMLMFIILQSIAYAGGKLIGKVTDSSTGEELFGVNIILVGRDLGGATDIEGDYLILNIPPGVYEVKASMIGFQSVTKTNVEIKNNNTTYLDFSLAPSSIELGESVVVTAERPLVETDLTSTRHFVSAEEISARPTDQLMTVLTTLPGIDVNSGGELVVRRGTLDQVAFLIDGVRARNPLDFQPYTNINLSAIQELEIITGGFSAEYGEAQSGVFNIITKEGGKNFEAYAEFRYTPPGLKHWGTALYDYSTTKFWENTHARHLQWWIDNPDMWVDPNGIYGNDPDAIWTPQQAYDNYIQTHQPVTNYTDEATYQTEISFGGPLPVKNMNFFFTGKVRTAPPVSGNSYYDRGYWYDGTLKLTYKLSDAIKLIASGFYNSSKTSYGMEYLAFENGFEDKYALYDYEGFPENSINSQAIKMTHVLSSTTFYELQFSRTYRYRSQSTFPGDEDGWESGEIVKDYLRAVDEFGNPIPGAYDNYLGLHTTGYYYRGEDHNTDFTLSGDLTSQIQKKWQLEAGFDLTYYNLDRFQEGKAYSIVEEKVYNPYEGNIYWQNKLEFEGLIMNLGLRFDFYNPNDFVYANKFDPFDQINDEEGADAETSKEKTNITGQLSPRIGISHPISDKTVLHFSYGHFFQRAPFGDYGEGTGSSTPGQTVTGILNTYLVQNDDGTTTPYNLGNRNLKPRKTVQYELGVEHNLGGIVTNITAFYKDYTNNIRTVTVFTDDGSSYLTTGNSNYSDSKGVEIAIRKPLSGLWGGYLNYSWSTGIAGRSGDPDVIASPNSGVQTRVTDYTGDFILYDPSRLKFGLVFNVPRDFGFLYSALSDMQISLDYSVYYPHEQIIPDNFSFGGKSFMRYAYKNALIRLRKQFNFEGFNCAFFVEVHNAFNDKHINLSLINSSTASLEDQAEFINSNFTVFPEERPNGGAFPNVIQYQNYPRSFVFGVSVGIL